MFKKIAIFCAALLPAVLGAHAETLLWADGFESSGAGVWATNATWKIGTPTVGPNVNTAGFRTHSGSRCAATGLTGNAPANKDVRLVCTNYNGQPYLTVPDASQFPRLRYWQWFSFVNALGYVEIQQQGSTNWQTISVTNIGAGSATSTSGGVWSRPSIDLAAFAGLNVQFAFHFTSGDSSFGSAPGWFVDEPAVVIGAPVFNTLENFEAGLGDWSEEPGTWEVGVPTSGPATNAAGWRAHSGTNCAGTVLAGNYGWNTTARLVTPPFVVPTSNRPALKFAEWFQFVNALGFVEINSGIVLTNLSYTTNFFSVTNVNRNTNIISVTNDFLSVFLQTNTATFTNLNIWTNVFPVTNSGSVTSHTNVLAFTNVNTGTVVFTVTNNLGFIYLRTNVYLFTNVNTLVGGVNITTAQSTNVWRSISTTNISAGSGTLSSGGWIHRGLDLSSFAGQTLRAAFHFESGSSGFGNAPGWYVDDVTLVTASSLTVPNDTNIIAGSTFAASASATNDSEPAANYLFALAAASTNAFITTNGVFNWTNTHPAIGTYTFAITSAADGVPPVTTNSFTVTVEAPVFSLIASNTLATKKYFLLKLQGLTNTLCRIDASTNLANATNWRPVFTSTVPGGLLLYTDRLATNFPTRFYRAVYP